MLASLTRRDLDEYAKVPDTLPPDATAKQIFESCRDWVVAHLPTELKELVEL